MKPLFARVLLGRPKEEKIRGVIIPEESQRRLAKNRCKVLDVGPTCNPEIKNLIGQDVLIAAIPATGSTWTAFRDCPTTARRNFTSYRKRTFSVPWWMN